MAHVTDSQKCYIHFCLVCNLMFDTVRKHTITCSGACRVRLHRDPVLREYRDRLDTLCRGMGITVADVLRAKATVELLGRERADAEPRQKEIYDAYIKRVIEAAKLAVKLEREEDP